VPFSNRSGNCQLGNCLFVVTRRQWTLDSSLIDYRHQSRWNEIIYWHGLSDFRTILSSLPRRLGHPVISN